MSRVPAITVRRVGRETAAREAGGLTVLRLAPSDDPAAGHALLVRLGGRAPGLSPRDSGCDATSRPAAAGTGAPRSDSDYAEPLHLGPWRELFVLAGRLRLGELVLNAGDYAAFQDGTSVEAAAEGETTVVAFAIVEPGAPTKRADLPAQQPLAAIQADRPAEVTCHRNLSGREWGYLDTRDGTDRLPLRYERSRGESTWLLRFPPGHRGPATRATGVGLEVLVVSGDLRVEGVEEPLESGDYACFARDAIPGGWQSTGGCELLLRTIAGADGAP